MHTLPGPEDNTIVFCQCVGIKNRERFLRDVPDHVSRTLSTHRLSPGYQPKWYPPELKPREWYTIEPYAYVARNGFDMGDQIRLLKVLGERPLNGYTLIGPTGVGKTFLLYALAAEAVMANRRALYYKVTDIIDWARREAAGEECIELADLPQPEGGPGFPMHLIIDEVDSLQDTGFARDYLMKIVDWCYSYPQKAVLSCGSNLGLPDLAKSIGPAITRRIKDITTVITIGGK